MLDVHPPHESVHTWKDFFIHIATICVGLLIAICLEQTVEALHHRHQRHELEVQMRNEAQRNLDLTQINITRLTDKLNWERAAIAALSAAPAIANRVSLSVLPPAGKVFAVVLFDPSQTAWTVAKANGSVALLPEDEAQVYARLDHDSEELNLSEDELLKAEANLLADTEANGGVMVYRNATLSLAARDAFVHTLSGAAAHTQFTISQESSLAGSCRGVLSGARSVNELLEYSVREGKQYDAQHPPRN